MHAGIDAYVEMANRHEHDDNRQEALRGSLFEYYVEQLEEHGYEGGREGTAEVMSIDVDLNAQGLDVWLNRRS